MDKALQIAATAFLITAAAIKAAPAIAEPVAPAVNVSLVRTADLDLSTQRGQRALDARLVVAAHEVCGSASQADLEGQNDVRKCRADVLAKANGQREHLLAAARGGVQIAITDARSFDCRNARPPVALPDEGCGRLSLRSGSVRSGIARAAGPRARLQLLGLPDDRLPPHRRAARAIRTG